MSKQSDFNSIEAQKKLARRIKCSQQIQQVKDNIKKQGMYNGQEDAWKDV